MSIAKLVTKIEEVALATDGICVFDFDDLGKKVNTKRREKFMRFLLKPPRIVVDLKEIKEYTVYRVTFFVFDEYTIGERKAVELATKWDKTTNAGKLVIDAIAASHPEFIILDDPEGELGQHKHNQDMAATKFDLLIRVWDDSLC